jgi:hypothetical protein
VTRPLLPSVARNLGYRSEVQKVRAVVTDGRLLERLGRKESAPVAEKGRS